MLEIKRADNPTRFVHDLFKLCEYNWRSSPLLNLKTQYPKRRLYARAQPRRHLYRLEKPYNPEEARHQCVEEHCEQSDTGRHRGHDRLPLHYLPLSKSYHPILKNALFTGFFAFTSTCG